MDPRRQRIVSLLTLARHPNTPRHEAESALAIASRLMQRDGYAEHDLPRDPTSDDTVVVEEVALTGTYVRQRLDLLWAVCGVHSCTGYVVPSGGATPGRLVIYGRRDDIFAARTLFAAADLLGARLIPRGSRSWRVSWWKGFRAGITEALEHARADLVAESPGAGLVLSDRGRRAAEEMRARGPRLRASYSRSDTSAGSYADGVAAGRQFSAPGRQFAAGVRGLIG